MTPIIKVRRASKYDRFSKVNKTQKARMTEKTIEEDAYKMATGLSTAMCRMAARMKMDEMTEAMARMDIDRYGVDDITASFSELQLTCNP